jgi:hypothetical protein
LSIIGKLHDTVIAWHPAAWLITKWAFRPLAMQRSNNAENLAAVTAGGGSVQVVFFKRICVHVTSGHARPHGGGGLRQV